MNYKKDNFIYWPTLAESSDLNPIEMWHELKSFHRQIIKPKNKDELVDGIHQFWESVTPGKCQHYINHLQKVIPALIEREGKAFGH